MERRGVVVHYPLLAAAGYVGLLVFHGGFSGSAPLKVTDGRQIAEIFGADAPFGAIDLKQTILSPMNLVVTGGLLVIAPVLMGWMCPKGGLAKGASAYGVREGGESDGGTPSALGDSGTSPARTRGREERGRPEDSARSAAATPGMEELERKPILVRVLEDSPLVTAVLVGLIAVWGFRYYWPAVGADGLRPPSGVLSLTPDTVNLTVLGLGLLLHGTPMRYVRAVEEAARGCAGIILQFPLYAGIMGLMAASGLSAMMATAMAGSAGPTTLPLWTLLSAGVVNLFVPSGGGQWAVQGPIAMRAAAEIGVDPGKMVMAVAYGDELTNMLQPFWALPLLAITGVKARDIVGYTAILMVVAGLWMGIGLLAF
jgi:short-chain fatty acids transporter